MKKNKKIWNLISVIFTIILFVSVGVFSYSLLQVNVIPDKYLMIGFGVLFLIILILLLMMFAKTRRWVKVISYIIITLISSGFLYTTSYLNSTNKFFTGTQIGDYDVLTYSVIALKDSNYSTIEDLKDKKISFLQDDYSARVKNELNKKINYQESLVTEFGLLPDYLLKNETDAIILEESYFTLVKEEVENFSDNTKVIYNFEIKVKSHQEESTNIEISKDSFILYISGIDQYGNVTSVRGRSDVNQIAVVNPRTNHILLVNTPRDYYVQLAGTTGLKDKLTHAGIYGIGKSVATLENLYDIDINHYLRVNFNTLIKVVDIIGGIDIYSDASFTCHTNRKVHVEKGWNHFNGTEALAYSRERYAYITGDHHRGANQQQVITAIINKVSQSSVLISKYNSILNALDGSFQTDIDQNTITSFIKYQLDKMPTWKVESIAATGYNSSNYTYSMGTGTKLYVMEPDMASVRKAAQRINEVYNEE